MQLLWGLVREEWKGGGMGVVVRLHDDHGFEEDFVYGSVGAEGGFFDRRK